jgi:predicted RND superfamily exporter protein
VSRTSFVRFRAYLARSTFPNNVNQQIDALEDQRKVTKTQPTNQGRKDWNFFTFDGIYDIWEFYAVSVEELILTTVIGVAAVTGAAFLFIPHLTAALFVLPLISILYVDLLGVLQWSGAHVNPVSYIAMVMSIGLLVDYVMHVLLRYYESPGNHKEKTVEMLRTMGSSILIGGISTFLGSLPLAFSTSTIFRTVFFAFVPGLVSPTLGCGHGLILLPVILATIGPEDQVDMQGVKRSQAEERNSVTSSDERA